MTIVKVHEIFKLQYCVQSGTTVMVACLLKCIRFVALFGFNISHCAEEYHYYCRMDKLAQVSFVPRLHSPAFPAPCRKMGCEKRWGMEAGNESHILPNGYT